MTQGFVKQTVTNPLPAGLTIPQPNIQGVVDASNALAGSVGEVISSSIASGSATSLTNNVAKNVTSISLTAGDWDVFGNVTFISSGGTAVTQAWTSLTSATAPDLSLRVEGAGTSGLSTPYMRVNVNTTTTVYLSCAANITSGTCTACGNIYARRVR